MVAAIPKPRRLIVTAREARALREGATQVRRPIDVPEWATSCGFSAFTPPGHVSARGVTADGPGEKFVELPLVAGQRYYVAETCAFVEPRDDRRLEYDGARLVTLDEESGIQCEVWYRADGELGVTARMGDDGPRWRSAATMPRWAARTEVVVEAVRVERVQDATEEDAQAMRYAPLPDDPACPCQGDDDAPGPHSALCPWRDVECDPDEEPRRTAMRFGWDAEHPRSPWAANGWVAVGCVRRVEC